MKLPNRFKPGVCGIALFGLLAAGCQAPLAGNGEGLKLGTLLPITGDLAQFGGPMQDSARLLVNTVNACGGVLGQTVTLVNEDDQTEPAVGAQAMAKLAEVDQVAGVIGAASSAVSSAAVDIAVRNQVMLVSPASTSPTFTERARRGDFNGYWARTAPPDTFQGEALVQLAQQQGFQTVGVLSINNDYGNGLVQSFLPAFEASGGTVTNRNNPTRYDPGAATFDAEVARAFSGSPDAVLLVSYPETGSLILKTAYESGALNGQTQIIATDGLKDFDLANLVGRNPQGGYIAAGMIGTAPSAGGPALEAFRERYLTAYNNREPSVFDPNTWDAAALMVLAAEAAQSIESQDIRNHIQSVANPPGTEVTDVCEGLSLLSRGEEINYQGASGTVDLNEDGDVTGSYDVWEIDESGTLQIKDQILVESVTRE
ncbi:ABC transporter substrate-binding protein [Synechococcales cyanobacterium C]|uniref:ABC transporter substrate-binding protein n=1 Tax=Petrachloros mirabilis ULC683 TaxID=2781853 RepID=A0A8K1ZVY0_9CYAN|nr:ABC transporter substrate-binding protein [Petrachloros mirabilis]NCJ06210.1 ABC transporter substrate-binding protein [Petrachloros mirabilis ULC683]